jgi:hypothetical protein
MISQYNYRIRCTTDDKDEYAWGFVAPTVCPVDAGHTIDSSLTTIVGRKEVSDFYQESTYSSSGLLLTMTEWVDSTKTIKSMEEIVSYVGNKVSSVTTNYYDNYGSLIKTITETVSYINNKISSIERIET